jgi:hypothetical protein
MSREIFVNYRQGDMPDFAGRLFDRIADSFGEGAVFMDVDGIDPGLDFIDVLNEQLASRKVPVAIIAPEWAHAKDASGHRRLDDVNDVVRLEIATALERGVRVIPVLIGGADALRTEDLPTDLHPLARRQSVVVGHERFARDIQPLMSALPRVLDQAPAAASTTTTSATTPSTSAVAKALESLRGARGLSGFSVGSAISPQSFANARKMARIPDDIEVHGLFEFTWFKNANDSMALTDRGVYYRHSLLEMFAKERIFLPLDALNAVPTIKSGLAHVSVGNITFYVDGAVKPNQVVDVFNAIRNNL